MHDCGRFHWPATNVDYWEPEILRNVERDKENQEKLSAAGWKVLLVWECQLKTKQIQKTLERLAEVIRT